MLNFSPNTLEKSADVNQNFTDLSTGAGDAAANSLQQARADAHQNYVVGATCVWTITSGLVAAMTSGVVEIAGKRLTVAAIASHTFTASKDTYVDLQDNGDGTAVPVYVPVANGATTGMTLTVNSVRVALLVSGASLTTVYQSNIGNGTTSWFNTDPLGNGVYLKSPLGILRYHDYTAGTTSGSASPLANTSWTFIVPAQGAWLDYNLTYDWFLNAAPAISQNTQVKLDGTTNLDYVGGAIYTSGAIQSLIASGQVYLTPGSHSIRMDVTNTAATLVEDRSTKYILTPA